MNQIKDTLLVRLFFVIFICLVTPGVAQENNTRKDSVIVRRIYRDTIIYRYDTIRINYYMHTDTVWNTNKYVDTDTNKKKRKYNPNNWGIGPSVGAYYSPFNGFDINIGFGIQYYLFAVPSFRNPHLGHKKQRNK